MVVWANEVVAAKAKVGRELAAAAQDDGREPGRVVWTVEPLELGSTLMVVTGRASAI